MRGAITILTILACLSVEAQKMLVPGFEMFNDRFEGAVRKVTETERMNVYEEGVPTDVETTRIYRYDRDGRLLNYEERREVYAPMRGRVGWMEYRAKYDGERLVRVDVYDTYEWVSASHFMYDSLGRMARVERYEYSPDPYEEFTEVMTAVTAFVYDGEGRAGVAATFTTDNSVMIERYEYDTCGCVSDVVMQVFSEDALAWHTVTEYENDSNCNVLSEYESWPMTGQSRLTSYRHDGHGNIVKMLYADENDNVQTNTVEYTYDSAGNWVRKHESSDGYTLLDAKRRIRYYKDSGITRVAEQTDNHILMR